MSDPYAPRRQAPPDWQPPPQQGYYRETEPQAGPYYGDGRPPRRRRRRHRGLRIFAGIASGIVLIIIIASVAASHGGTAQPDNSAGGAAAPVGGTLTYVVTGSHRAQVTYGPSGSSLSGHAPLHVSAKLASPSFYSISAQLQGGGHVACKILIDGKVISQGTARGGYNIAQCEITQNPISGKWQSAAG